jgi:hypothetical protein
MPVSYVVAPHQVDVSASGLLTEADAVNLVSALASDPTLETESSMLFDAFEADADSSPEELARIAALFATLKPYLVRIAIVAGSDLMFGLAREYSVYAELVGLDVRPFRDRATAQGWLAMAMAH